MKCLRCEESMEILKNGSTEIDVCMNGCGGVWFDPFEFKSTNEPMEIKRSFMDQLLDANNNKVDTEPRLTCPECEGKMLRHFHSVRREIEIDQCSECYAHWLDGGELFKVVHQFNSPEEKQKATQEFFDNLKSNNKQ